MRTTVDVAPALLRRFRDEAKRCGKHFKQMLAGALRRGLDVRRDTPRRYRCPTHSLGRLPEHRALDKALRVAEGLQDERHGFVPRPRR